MQDTAEYVSDELPDDIVAKGLERHRLPPGFAWLDEQGIRPGVCLYFIDMESSRYLQTESPFPVLWCHRGDGDSPWR